MVEILCPSGRVRVVCILMRENDREFLFGKDNKKNIARIVICLCIILSVLFCRTVFLPMLLQLASRTYKLMKVKMTLDYLSLSMISWVSGFLIMSICSVLLKKNIVHRKIYFFAGLLLMLPLLLIVIEILLSYLTTQNSMVIFYGICMHENIKKIVVWLLPLLSGILVFIGINKGSISKGDN